MTPTPAHRAQVHTACPSCREPMRTVSLERKPNGHADIDLCARCRGLWFDGYESLQLTPGATLDLLREVHEAEREPRGAVAEHPTCPRCRSTLALTRDLMRSTRFSYHRCTKGHGRFTPFMQFLLEKNVVRPLPPAEIERLKRHVGTIRCSGCGSGIDLGRDTSCSYCRAPIAVLDADALGTTIKELSAAEAKRHHVDPHLLADALIASERAHSALAADRVPARADAIVSAIGLGATALDILFDFRR